MSVYFAAVVMLDDGPRPMYGPGGGGDLGAVTEADDGDARMAYAYLRERPRRVWWVADESPLGEHIIELWARKYGPGLWRNVQPVRDDIPASTRDYPVIINHDLGEWVDADHFYFNPLPLLAASFGTDSFAGNSLAGRWHGHTVSVNARGSADVAALTEIRDGQPPLPEIEPDDRLLRVTPELGIIAEFIIRASRRGSYPSFKYSITYNDMLEPTTTLSASTSTGTAPTSSWASALIRLHTTPEDDVAISWATTGTGFLATPDGDVINEELEGSITSAQVPRSLIDAAWTHLHTHLGP